MAELKNLAALFGAEVVSKVITFAAFAYIARTIGPAGFGYIEWAGALLLCASLLVDQGFSSYGAREIAKSNSATERLVSEIVTARFLIAGLGFAGICAFVLTVEDSSVRALLLVYAASLWLLPLLLQWVFQGHDKMHLVGISQVIRQVIFVATIFLFVRSIDDLIWIGFAELAGVAAAALFTIAIYRHYFGLASFRPTFSMRLFREAAPIGLSQMFWVAKMFGATFIVGLVATAADTGYFAGAIRIYVAIHTFVWLYFFNMMPAMSRSWQEGPEHLETLIDRSFRLVAGVCLIGGISWVAAAQAMMVGVYGADFLPGTAALQWLAGACIAAAISGHYRYALIASGHQSYEMIATAAGSILALVFVPVAYLEWQTGGAAAALFAAECLVLGLSWLFARRFLFYPRQEESVEENSALTILSDATR